GAYFNAFSTLTEKVGGELERNLGRNVFPKIQVGVRGLRPYVLQREALSLNTGKICSELASLGSESPSLRQVIGVSARHLSLLGISESYSKVELASRKIWEICLADAPADFPPTLTTRDFLNLPLPLKRNFPSETTLQFENLKWMEGKFNAEIEYEWNR